MQITISGHHIDITEGLEKAVGEKLTKLASHHPDLVSLKVSLTVEKHEHIAEITTHYLGKELAAKAKSGDLYLSITNVGEKLETLLRKRKNTVKSHSHDKIRMNGADITELESANSHIVG